MTSDIQERKNAIREIIDDATEDYVKGRSLYRAQRRARSTAASCFDRYVYHTPWPDDLVVAVYSAMSGK